MPALLLRSHNVPRSTRTVLAALTTVAVLILVVRLFSYRQALLLSPPDEQINVLFHNMRVPLLQLIPRTAVFYPWVFATAIFAETLVLSFAFSAAVLYVATKYVEKFWGSLETVKFVFYVGSLTNIVTVLITIVCNIFRGDVAGMDKPLGGGISYYFGFLVVLKQLIPEHNIVLFQGLINFRVKHLPFVLLVAVLLWSLLVSRSLYPAVPSLGSFFISYCYLRFFQAFVLDPLLPITSASDTADHSGQTVLRGDASDTFALVEFFPAVTKPFLLVVFGHVYDLSVLLGIITAFNDELVEQSNLRAQKISEQLNQPNKSVASSVAERRRQVALQVIEDRITKETRA